jgi:hypothetical protein
MRPNLLLSVAAIALALVAPGVAVAHEAAPKHGGIVRSASDLSFELVRQGDDAVIHVADHGKPLPTAGMKGKLTILQGGETREVALQPASESRLEAKGAKLGAGARVVASIERAEKKPITVRFAIK